MPENPQYLGRYRILERVGDEEPILYRAQDTKTGETVACAYYFRGGDRFRQEFYREIGSLETLPPNPHLILPRDYGVSGDSFYLVMNWVEDNNNLRKLLEQRKPLSVQEVIGIFKQTVDGLAELHKHGIVHRDIKPHNILFTKPDTVALVDFGVSLAKELDFSSQTRWLSYKIKYAAPEQLQGKLATPASDIYALGVILYELITKLEAPDQDTKVLSAKNPFTEWGNMGISLRFRNILTQCTAYSPEDRFGNAIELKRSLDKFTRDFQLAKKISSSEVTSREWKIAQLLVDPVSLFVLWLIKNHLCTSIEGFNKHFGIDFQVANILDQLEVKGFIGQQNGEYFLAQLGEEAVSRLDTD